MTAITASKTLRNVASLVAVLASLTFGTKAWASSETTTPQAMIYAAGNLLIKDSSGTFFSGQLSPTAMCSAQAQTIDTLKMWASLAQAALLSGKNVLITYTNACSTNYITQLELDQ
jgi:hypothetical protein